MKSVIDIGSNSCLLIIGEFDSDKMNILESRSAVTGLGRDLDKNQKFISEAMEETFDVLKSYKEIIESHGLNAQSTLATATEASRVSLNAKEFYDRVRGELGIDVQIISSDQEAYYSALGASLGYGGEEEEIILIDIGGASTEFIKVNLKNFKVLESVSLPIGVVRATDWREQGVLEEKFQEILSNFSLESYRCQKIIGIAGTATSHAAMFLDMTFYRDSTVHGLHIKLEAYLEFIDMMNRFTPEELLNRYPFIGKRSKVSHAGGYLLTKFCEALNVQHIVVSTYGLRHGVLSEGENEVGSD